MSYRVARLLSGEEPQWDAFVASVQSSQINHTIKWRDFCAELLEARPVYLIARNEQEAVKGALPAFLKQGQYGPVLNSLPFFGTNGGIVAADSDPALFKALVEAWETVSNEEGCISSTIITSPFDQYQDLFIANFQYDLTDSRIGQITPLPGGDEAGARIFASISSSCRRNIRKAEKSGLRVEQRNDREAWTFLENTHRRNMEAIGGKAKPERFFQLVGKHFVPGEDYRLYVCMSGDELVSALLLFYFNGIVEYFIPVVLPEYRPLAPQSLVIFRAMLDAVDEQYSYWNWGGTWKSQTGVYAFKKKWAAVDIEYVYCTRLINTSFAVREESTVVISRDYPSFYLAPFEKQAILRYQPYERRL